MREWHEGELTTDRERELCNLLNNDRDFRNIFSEIFEKLPGRDPGAPFEKLPPCPPAQREAFRTFVMLQAMEGKARQVRN